MAFTVHSLSMCAFNVMTSNTTITAMRHEHRDKATNPTREEEGASSGRETSLVVFNSKKNNALP